MAFITNRYAALRASPRNSAYRLRNFTGPLRIHRIAKARSLQVLLRLQNAHDYAARCYFGGDVGVPPQQAHPTFQCSPVESGLAFDLAISDRRSAEHPTC